MAKLGQIYDLQSFDGAKKYFEGQGTNDSSGGMILARNLEHVSSQVFEQRVAGLSFLTNSGITVNNEGGYADFITKLKVRPEGDFKLAGASTNGNGKISIGGESDSIKVFYKEANSDWSETDLQKASLQNINLVARFLQAHDTKYKENIDTIGYLGQDGKTKGLLNNTGFASDSAAKTFASSTALEMYNEVKDLVLAQRSAVLNDEMFSCNKLAVHPETYNLLNGTFMDSSAGLTTVREAIERTLGVAFVLTSKAKISNVNRIVAYTDSNLAMQMRIPVPLKMSNTYTMGFKYYIESMFGIAGFDLIEDLSGSILTGV
jgi:hypothetical protein